MTMNEQDRILIAATNTILTKVEELDKLILKLPTESYGVTGKLANDIMVIKLNALRRTVENTLTSLVPAAGLSDGRRFHDRAG